MPAAPEALGGSIAITGARVSPGEIRISGTASLPAGSCVLTELLAGESLEPWWPTSRCATSETGDWRMAVDLGRDGAPEGLDPTVQYVLRARQRDDPSVEAVFWLEMAGPPEPEPWVEFNSPLYGVSLTHPADWEPVTGYDERYGGAGGFFQLAALDGQGWTLAEACDLEAHHKLQPYGTQPTIEELAGQLPGCLILPSDDQPAGMSGHAGLVVPYPRPHRIGESVYHFFILWADRDLIRPIVATLRFDTVPGVAGVEPALVWEEQDEDGRCHSLQLSADGIAGVGMCGSPPGPVPAFGAYQYLGHWPHWLGRFAPFEAQTASGRVTLRGQGQEVATGDWQRALDGWARLVWMELRSGRSGASWGAALAGHWAVAEQPGTCRFLQVETFGYAYASTARCEGGDPRDLGRGWLEAAEWQQFDLWFHSGAPLSSDDIDFFGAGGLPLGEEEAGALNRWAAAVYDRLAAAAEPQGQEESGRWVAVSPDGRWTTVTSMQGPYLTTTPEAGEGGGEEQYRARLTVTRTDGSVRWTVVDDTLHFGLGYTLPFPFHWSDNGGYLVYTNRPVPDGCALFVNGSDLHQVDLATGLVSPLLEQGACCWLSLSPDETRLAYMRWTGESLQLVLRDLATGEERETVFDARYSQGGAILWSPDGQGLVVTLVSAPCDPANWRQAVVYIDAATLAQRTLIADNERLLSGRQWPDANRLQLNDKDGGSWWLDVATGALAAVPTASDLVCSSESGATGRPLWLPGLVFSTSEGLRVAQTGGLSRLLLPIPAAHISPDGRHALYTTDSGTVVVDLSSGVERALPTPQGYTGARWPRWAGNDLILFGALPADAEPGPSFGHLSAAQADGDWVRVLDPENLSNRPPALSPDGETIAYDRGGSAWLTDWEGQAEQLSLSDAGDGQTGIARAGGPAWSPGGDRLAWVVGGDVGDGRRLAVVLLDLEKESLDLLYGYEPLGIGGWPDAPVWSPDGRWLAYVAWAAADPAQGGLWVLSSTGEGRQWLGKGSKPVWSPQGCRLLYTTMGSQGQAEVWMVEPGVWEPQRLVLPAGAVVVDWPAAGS